MICFEDVFFDLSKCLDVFVDAGSLPAAQNEAPSARESYFIAKLVEKCKEITQEFGT